MSDVAFDGGRFPLADVQENPARYVKRLERAKVAPGHPLCLCTSHDTPLQLVIRRYGSLLHLAGWPDDGHRHARGCAFHKDPSAAKPAGLNVKLDASLTLRETNSGSRSSPAQTSNRPGRRSASLLAFLQTLWCEARLNEWTGLSTTRHWGQCNAQQLAELSTARINGADAQTVLHVMRRFEEADRAEINAEFDSFIGRLSATHRGLVIGEVSEVTPTQYGHALSLRHSARKYYASTTLIDHAARAWPHAWRALGGDRAARVVAILLVERTPKGHLKLLDLAAMLCSSAFIPCDSIHEVAMANRLVTERRDFVKPVRMSPQDDMLPDFVLRDAGAQTHVEVYGMNGVPAYETRKEEKRAPRLARGIPALEWDVDREPLAHVQLPPLRDAGAT
ncbi:DUF1173 family protein [Paraburkholderia atlantica]|uniref:DUF1173 family protein n=1 Tax=Paraburkholderia atlantica TaxID=2654982 RepID=UPI001609A3DE|nr:DUF1173 family protein [Paraburkholderia atlantica]MBB5420655.1 hypothetical protein [Paraburkholderia atlantica]